MIQIPKLFWHIFLRQTLAILFIAHRTLICTHGMIAVKCYQIILINKSQPKKTQNEKKKLSVMLTVFMCLKKVVSLSLKHMF